MRSYHMRAHAHIINTTETQAEFIANLDIRNAVKCKKGARDFDQQPS